MSKSLSTSPKSNDEYLRGLIWSEMSFSWKDLLDLSYSWIINFGTPEVVVLVIPTTVTSDCPSLFKSITLPFALYKPAPKSTLVYPVSLDIYNCKLFVELFEKLFSRISVLPSPLISPSSASDIVDEFVKKSFPGSWINLLPSNLINSGFPPWEVDP